MHSTNMGQDIIYILTMRVEVAYLWSLGQIVFTIFCTIFENFGTHKFGLGINKKIEMLYNFIVFWILTTRY